MTFVEAADGIVTVIEAIGIAVILFGITYALGHAAVKFLSDRDPEAAYLRVRHGVGRALMLGLDLLIASEIVRSITTETLESVAVLGLTIVVRTFLSVTLAVEIDGRVPWNRGGPRVDVSTEQIRLPENSESDEN